MHLLQVYSNPTVNRASPQTLVFRSTSESRERITERPQRRLARQLRSAEIDKLVDRYRLVRNVKQVAREFGISRATAAKHLADRGVETSRGMSAAETETAIRLYSQGLSSAAIGQELGFDNHTILNAIRAAGLRVRRPVAVRLKKREC